MEDKRKKRIKGWIIALSIMLGVSVIALGLLFVYKNNASQNGGISADIAGDNIITPEKENNKEDNKDKKEKETDSDFEPTSMLSFDLLQMSLRENENETLTTANEQPTTTQREPEGSIELYQSKESDNKEIHLENMFPGDSVLGTYGVKVYFEDTAQVHFEAKVLGGDEILAKGLCVKVIRNEDQKVLYDGPIADLGEKVQTNLEAKGKSSCVLTYNITTYLPTSAGNEYMNKKVTVSYIWWAEGHLIPPQTGDRNNMTLWLVIGVAAVLAILAAVLILVIKRKGDKNGKK